MSNVFSRFHHPTGVEYWDNAALVDAELYRIMTNEKIVPKSRRFIYTIPILNLMGREWLFLSAAYDIYPTGEDAEEKLERKKAALRKAREVNEAILRQIQVMVIRHPEIDVNKLDNLGELIVKESALLDKARENSKVQNGRAKPRWIKKGRDR